LPNIHDERVTFDTNKASYAVGAPIQFMFLRNLWNSTLKL